MSLIPWPVLLDHYNVAAIRDAQLGMSVALIEREDLGGVCLNWGCIPTKALLKSAELVEKIKQADKYGIAVNGYSIDLGKMVQRSRQVAGNLNKGIGHLLKKNKVSVIFGTAKLLGKGKLSIAALTGSSGSNGPADEELQAKHIIIACGAKARAIPGIESLMGNIFGAQKMPWFQSRCLNLCW